MQLPMSDFPGRTVVDITGRVLGRVAGLVIDTENWVIPSLRLRLRRDPAQTLGLRWSLFRAPCFDVPTALVMAASDTVILRAALDELHELVPAEARADVRYAEPASAT